MRVTLCIIASLILSGCPSTTETVDSGLQPSDAAGVDAPVGDGDGGVVGPYRHTIAIDGTNDFAAADVFTTTSAGYSAFVSWDDTHVYIGYSGEDIATAAPESANKWVLVYFDTDPGFASGAVTGEQYNTQAPGFPTNFGAEYYYRWKSDDSFEDLQHYDGAWSTTASVVDASVNGTYMEVAIPIADLGSPSSIGVVSLMVNETSLAEGAYAGLYDGSFADGYYDVSVAPIPMTKYLHADFASSRAPNDAENERP
jgi:hypothetical protein